MQVRKLSEISGVEVSGIDLSRRSAYEDRALGRLFDQHGLVVFRDQRLSKQELVDAGAAFGGTMIDRPAGARDPDAPGIFVLSTRGPRGDVIPADPEELIAQDDWHTDQGYVTAPNRGKLLYAVNVPEEGGLTGFIDGRVTYNALPDDMKERVEGLHVIQSWNAAEITLARNRPYRDKGELDYDMFPDVAYPIVYEHPMTRERVLNLPPLWCAGIVEMPGAEGDELAAELMQHIKQPGFQYWHRYQKGDAVLWDNWSYLHAASGTRARYVRTLWGIAIQGGPELGYVLPTRNASASKQRPDTTSLGNGGERDHVDRV